MQKSHSSNSPTHHRFHGTHYVISEDIDILVGRWCKGVGLKAPDRDFYSALRAKMRAFLRTLFAHVTFIGSKEIRDGLLASIALHKKAGLTVVSLERAYLNDVEIDGRIELTRTVDESGNDILVHAVRSGAPDKRVQFERLSGKNLALIDDVAFSGKTLISTISELNHYHSNVHAVTVAVGVKKGVDALKREDFGVVGMPKQLQVHCLEEFTDVSDQVCERDFYPGVPYCGREHFNSNAAFPYILPFGKPDTWASIPEKELERFSALCIENTIALFEKIEQLNHRTIPCSMVPRPVFGLPRDKTRFVAALRRVAETRRDAA